MKVSYNEKAFKKEIWKFGTHFGRFREIHIICDNYDSLDEYEWPVDPHTSLNPN